MKHLFVILGAVFVALFFLAPDREPFPAPADHDDKVLRAYDGNFELDQIIKDNQEQTRKDLEERHAVLQALVDHWPESEALPSLPGSESLAGSGAGTSVENEEPKGYLTEPIDPAKGTLLPIVEVLGVEYDSPKYDDAEWHYGGDFPEGVPISHGFTHIGFFLTWIVDSGLESEFIQTASPRELAATKRRDVSPIALLEFWDGQLIDDMLSDEGNAFAAQYYNMSNAEAGYFADYSEVFGEAGTYEIEPTWENYDRIKPVISRRYEEWKAENAKP
ncbi:MAG: hypothetical protein KAH44_11970 [Oricola sp.]|jgi:hypothetical protein|nr:hypothetical protein [Oricola sp.]